MSHWRRSGRRGGKAIVLGLALTATALLAFGTSRASFADERDGTRDGGHDAARGPVAPGGHVMPADLEDVEHMCALLTACEKLPLPSGIVPHDFVGCTRTLYAELASPAAAAFSLTLRDCGLRASSCGELRSCALRGAKVDVCTGRGKAGPVDMCDGDGRAITCINERVSLVRDCPRGGEQCVVREGHAVCALGSCEKEAAPACSVSGTRVLECKKGKLLSLDCGAFGLQCTSSADGPKCATQAPACREGATRCEGATAVGCYHGHEVRIDCGARGLACGVATGDGGGGGASSPSSSSSMGAVGACAVIAPPRPAGADGGASASCDPSAVPRCDGASLRWCAWGQPRSYLCKSVGLQRCVSDDKGARCAP
ncbi:MAG: hypothetical protein JWO86_715 [Myxococcaceae bacterium]|nr:hypothetical protein [Myxococcaceae bacterium]